MEGKLQERGHELADKRRGGWGERVEVDY